MQRCNRSVRCDVDANTRASSDDPTYSTCLFCNKSLGATKVVEAFPIGRRLAFDAAKGRLWVVCRKCERWNLTPLEERWDAIETCQRLFAETRTRVSTDNIGLARLREGLELVRIGQPLRPEFAAWRYGDQFGRRRRCTIVYGTGAAVVGVGLMAGSLAVGVAPVFLDLWQLWWNSRSSTKLALEMAVHEEQERRALAGELKALELAWKRAEEIAGIADNLLLPESARAFIKKHRPTGE